MTHQEDRRLIEETFPVKEVSLYAAKEKNIRHGHISTLHIWWARRPLAASRATAYAALVPPPEDIMDWQKQRTFITELSKWENSLNQDLLARARQAIYEAHAQRLSEELGEEVTVEDIETGKYPPPRVLDPFAGGGSYPLEALRLGCEAYANDYNPVAVLILKATLEYPQKYGRPFEGMPAHLLPKADEVEVTDEGQMTLDLNDKDRLDGFNPLLAAVKYWGDWVLEEARKELAQFYPPADEDETVVGYIWARTLPCQNPTCGVEIPLMRQFWLAKKGNKKQIALRPITYGPGKPIDFEIVARGTQIHGYEGYKPWAGNYNPSHGTVRRAVVTCPACGATIEANTTRRLFREGKSGQRMVAVVYTRKGTTGKFYRLPAREDLEIYDAAQNDLSINQKQLRSVWGLEPIPDEPLPPQNSHRAVGSQLPIYGYETWGDLFNPRQLLALLTIANLVRNAYNEMLSRGYAEDFSKAVITYLGLMFDLIAAAMNTLTRWDNTRGNVKQVFSRQALPMLWDYVETYPFSKASGGAYQQITSIQRVLDKLQPPANHQVIANISHASATHLPWTENTFDGILTDPPYYDNVPYSYLSDFFYVWLKRTVGYLYPDLFTTPLTPKSNEIVVYDYHGAKVGKEFFEKHLSTSFVEMYRVLKPGGVAVIVYAHKSTEGWETVINALLDSGMVVTAAWPLNTEMSSRLVASETAALASSIYIVARKTQRQGIGFYHEVRRELEAYLNAKLQRLWEEGIGGADFFIAAIGAAIEVFGKYEQVMDLEGNIIRADRLLDEVRTIATDFAVRQILHNGFAGEVSDRTRLYVLWRWNYGEARVPFDEARKLAQSCGLDLVEEWSRSGSFVKKDRDFVRVLGPLQRDTEDLARSRELIDVLHHALLLWQEGNRPALVQRLAETGYGNSEAFYRVAQAISESLPNESKEKKLLDGLLTGRDRLREQVRQATLF